MQFPTTDPEQYEDPEMTWIAKDDRQYLERPVRSLSDAAYRLYDQGLAFANHDLTDGVVPRSELEMVKVGIKSSRISDHVEELCLTGLWHRQGDNCASEHCPLARGIAPGDGWVIHDYFDLRPTRAHVEARQLTYQERARLAGIASGAARRARAAETPSSELPSSLQADYQAGLEANSQANLQGNLQRTTNNKKQVTSNNEPLRHLGDTPKNPVAQENGPALQLVEGVQELPLRRSAELFVGALNAACSRRYQATGDVVRHYANRRKDGYSHDDLIAAAQGAATSPWHKEHNQYQNPVTVLRSRMLQELIAYGRGEVVPEVLARGRAGEVDADVRDLQDTARRLRAEGQ